MRSMHRVAAALALVALPLVSTACGDGSAGSLDESQNAAPRGRQQLSGHVTTAMTDAPLVERVPPATPMHLSIVLPVRNADDLQARVGKVSDPSDPSFRSYLTPAQYAEQYAPLPADYQALTEWATSQGLAVVRSYPNRLVLAVSTTSDAVERAFHVEMSYRARLDGTRFFAPDREPSIDLDVPVGHIEGLSDIVLPKPASCLNQIPTTSGAPVCLEGTGPDEGYAGTELRNAYLGATSCASLTGAGQSVALVEYNGFTPQDIAAFAAYTGVPAPTVRTPLENNPPTPSTFGDDGHAEVALDIEMVWSMAPGATIDVYEGQGQTDILAAIATTQPLSLQVSSSWFDGNNIYVQSLLDELALQGQSYFQASGDNGGFMSNGDIRSASGVTVVGGTVLGVNPSAGAAGYYQEEAAWTQPPSFGSGGGFLGTSGATLAVPIPYYQQGVSGYGPGFSTQYRNLPDVSMVAETLATTYSLTATGPAQTAPEDGTSAATPLWAGVMALVNQQTPSKPVGFANPALYALGKTNAGYFHDVVADQTTTGGPAAMFAAARGYDLVTGWGSPTCSLITSLAGNSSEHAPTTALPSGFKTWGGQENQCLSTAGERVAAGIGLVSETCNPSFVAQNWVLSYSHGAISPATNTSLCIDGNASTGTVSLEGCNGGPTQTWTVGSTIISAAGNGLTYCLNVEYKPGYPMNVETCAQTPLQTFWPFGFPLAFMNAAGDQCLNNVADGATMDDTNCRPNAGAPPRSEIFVLTESNQIVASGGFTAADATTAGPSSACVNLDGLGQNGTSPYYSSLSTWSCGNGPSTTSQEWYLQPAGLHNGQWSWAAIQSSLPSAGECIDMLGANPNPLTQADVWTCNYTSAQLWQLSILPTDEIGFGGY